MGLGMSENKLSGTVCCHYSCKQSAIIGLTFREMQSNADASFLLENRSGLKDAWQFSKVNFLVCLPVKKMIDMWASQRVGKTCLALAITTK